MQVKKIAMVIITILSSQYSALSQNVKEGVVEKTSHFIGNLLKDSLNYRLLASLDCKDAQIKQLLLEFKFDQKQKFYEVDIKNDSLKKVTSVFAETLRLTSGKLNEKFVKLYHDKLIVQPILYSVYCSKEQIVIDTFNYSKTTITDKELANEFQKQLRTMMVNFINLFGVTKNETREMKNVLIFPAIIIDGNSSNQLKK